MYALPAFAGHDTLIETTDSRLFRSITYPDHCLNYLLLPSKRNYTMQCIWGSKVVCFGS